MPTVRVIIFASQEIGLEIETLVKSQFALKHLDTTHLQPDLYAALKKAESLERQSPDDPLVVIAAGPGKRSVDSTLSYALQQFPGLLVYDIRELYDSQAMMPDRDSSLDPQQPPATWRYRQYVEEKRIPNALAGLLAELRNLITQPVPETQIVPDSSAELDR